MKALGYIYYTIATKCVDEPKPDLKSPAQLNQLDDASKQQLAFELIRLLLAQITPNETLISSVAQLQRHPFFTINLTQAKISKNLLGDHRIVDAVELRKWFETKGIENYTKVDYEGLSQIVNINFSF